MKSVNKLLRLLAVVLVISMMMATVAFAAETGKVWLSVTQSGKDTVALIVTDTTVTDGLVKVTYDPEALTYKGVMVSSEYVAMHSVNAEEAGTVLISWVAPEAYEADGSALTLIEVTFEGEDTAIEATGMAHDAEGNELPIGTVDTSALEEAIDEAETLNGEDYTEETWTALEEAKEAAEAVLADPTATQDEVDEAAAALKEAIAALEKAPAEPSEEPTEPSEEPTEPVDKSDLEKAIDKAESLKKADYNKKSWDAMQAALKVAEKVLAYEDATQEEVDAAADALNKAIKALVPATGKNPGTGDETQIVLVFAMGTMALVGIGALLVMNSRNKKKGGK